MSDLKLALIQAGFRMSLERFIKMYEIIQTKVKEGNLENKMLKTNHMKKKLDNLVEKIQKRVKKYIKNYNITQTKEALLRLIHIEKRNMVRQIIVRRNGDKI